jgi:mRNA-degrading endonuclease RelE of RelBE toxin-antitoxin system
MRVLYREAFLRDLKKLKKQPVYKQIYDLVFTALPEAKSLKDMPGVKTMTGYSKRRRMRIGEYRRGIETRGDTIEVSRVLHRKDFYRYFP